MGAFAKGISLNETLHLQFAGAITKEAIDEHPPTNSRPEVLYSQSGGDNATKLVFAACKVIFNIKSSLTSKTQASSMVWSFHQPRTQITLSLKMHTNINATLHEMEVKYQRQFLGPA